MRERTLNLRWLSAVISRTFLCARCVPTSPQWSPGRYLRFLPLQREELTLSPGHSPFQAHPPRAARCCESRASVSSNAVLRTAALLRVAV